MAEQGHEGVVSPEDGNPAQAVPQANDSAGARERRIAQLRSQYRERSYEVDELKLAAAIIERHLIT